MSAEDSAPRVASPTDVPPHISVAADGDDQMRGPGSPGPTGASLGTARSVQFHVLTKLSVRADTDAEDSSNNHLSASERRPNGKLDRRSLAGDARMNMDFLKLPDIDVALAPHEALQLAEQEHQAAQELHDEEVVQEVVIQGEDTTHALGTEADSGHHHRVRTHIKTQKVKTKKPKLTAPSTWLKVDNSGVASLIQVDKHKLTHKLGVQTRDLRILDPMLAASSPSAILDRDKAIVVNLEHVKCIITLDYVLVVNPELESSAPLVNELKIKLAGGRMGKKTRSYQGLSDAASNVRMMISGGFDLPFELKALEICLDMMAVHLDEAAKALEAEAYPTLDALTHKVSAGNLERTRRIKNRLVRLKTRVETIREVLERFLNDDEDMHRLHLTGNEISRQASFMAAQAAQEAAAADEDSGSSVSTASSDSSMDEAETAVVEMLLEAYFMYLDSTYNRLQTLHEYIGDTEDLVSIKLDQHRNQLISIDLMLTSFGACLGIMTCVGGYFGMNLYSGLQDTPGLFTQVSVITSIGALLVFVVFVWWMNSRRLLTY